MTDPNAVPSTAPEKAGLIEDFVDIFTSPSAVFSRRANASAFLPWLIVAVLMIGLILVNRNVMANINDAMMNRGIEKVMAANPSIPAEQIATQKAMMEKFAPVGAIVAPPILLLVIGLVTWVIGKIFGGTLKPGTGVLITAYAFIPRVVEQILLSIQGLVLDTSTFTSPYQVSLGAARFVNRAAMSPALVGALASVDVIAIWGAFLTATGLVYAGKVPREKLITVAVVIWLITLLMNIWGAFNAMM